MKKEFQQEKLNSTSREPPRPKVVTYNVLRKTEFDTEKFWYYYTEIRKE